MRTATVEYKVYKYDELNTEAKEKVKQWYLDGQESDIFTGICLDDLVCLFGRTDLKVQYDLGYCQGDGFNIYGSINAKDIIKCLESGNGGTQLEQFENVLTDKEKKTILAYQKVCEDIKLPCNNHYCYCVASNIDITNDWEYDLEYSGYSNINKKVLQKFEELVKDIFLTLCSGYEQQGYEYFYEIEEEDLTECCEANEYEFLSNGELFTLA